MQVEDLMTKSVECCEPDDALERAAQLMWDHDCGCLPVCVTANGGRRKTIGVVTDRDICMCALFQHKPLSELRVADAMAKEVISCLTSDAVQQVKTTMRSARVRRLPVLNVQGTLVGMISLADLAREGAHDGNHHEASELDVRDTLAMICTPPQRAAHEHARL
jgi:predicted transcriptional regulator